jgi:hypothetical protein
VPPRYAYWTILIDSKPTAFRAREKGELLPTLQQLRRTNTDVVMKWFARGRLWESPEAARSADRAPKPPERRTSDWRPGGQHKDPRDRFKNKKKRGDHTRPWSGAGQGGEGRPWRDKPAAGTAPRGNRPWNSKPSGSAARGDRPWSNKPAGSAPRGNRPWNSKPSGSTARGDRPWSNKPTGSAPRGNRPWNSKAPGSTPRGDRPSSTRPPGKAPDGDRGWRDMPSGKGGSRRPWRNQRGGQKSFGGPKTFRQDMGPERGETEVKPRKESVPEPPPSPEPIVTKPEPRERG